MIASHDNDKKTVCDHEIFVTVLTQQIFTEAVSTYKNTLTIFESIQLCQGLISTCVRYG